MNKFVFWAIVFAIGFGLFKFAKILERKSAARRAARPDPDAARELVLSCAYCGVHVPASEAIMSSGKAYCCVEHRDMS
jgi:uncharacterized protein